jgi:ribonuclease HI
MIAWRAWFARNEITHDKPLPAIEGSRRFLCSYVQTLSNIRCLTTDQILKGKQPCVQSTSTSAPVQTEQPQPELCWEKPDAGSVKLNVDGAFDQQSGTAAAGMILRDATGGIIFSSCRSMQHCTSALEAELCACMEGIALAVQWSQEPIIVETDCALVVSMVTSKDMDSSYLGHLVAEVKIQLASDRQIRIVKIPRTQNKASDALARFGRISDRTVVWLRSGPDDCLDFILRDCNTHA